MKIVGFSFNKINIERFSTKAEELKINTNININEIDSVKADLFKAKNEFISIKFSYIIKYEPEYAKIELSGNILVSIEPKLAKQVIKDWKDNKKLQEDFRIFVFNVILTKSNLKALALEDELNLPIHIPLPSVKRESQEKNIKK